jgi:hypothetical protein
MLDVVMLNVVVLNVVMLCVLTPSEWHHFRPASLPLEWQNLLLHKVELTYLSINIGCWHEFKKMVFGFIKTEKLDTKNHRKQKQAKASFIKTLLGVTSKLGHVVVTMDTLLWKHWGQAIFKTVWLIQVHNKLRVQNNLRDWPMESNQFFD